MRHLAYLSAVPRQPERKNRSLADTSAEEKPISRLKRMEADGVTPDMPPVSAPFLIGWLMEIGPVEAAGMDRAPISWATMRAWEQIAGISLEPWQARLLRRLSADYLSENRAAEDPDAVAPWGGVAEDQRAAVDAKLRAAFGGLARKSRR